MLKLRLACSAGALLTTLSFGAAPAGAHTITYVSGKGSDSKDCLSPATVCTFQQAFNVAMAGGEVKALDPADYGPVSIAKSIAITGVVGAGINMQGKSGSAIAITGGPNAVFLTNLILDGGVSAGGATPPANGVTFSAGGQAGTSSWLTITHCTVQHLGTGVFSTGGFENTAKLVIADTVVTDVSTGITAFEHAGVLLDHVLVNGNAGGTGLVSDLRSGATVVDSVFDNFNVGISAGGSVYLAHSTITGNATGVSVSGGATYSFGDNHIYGNTTNVSGTLTKVGAQ